MTTVLKNILSALFHLPKREVKSIVDHHTKRSLRPPDSPEEPDFSGSDMVSILVRNIKPRGPRE